MLKWANMRGCSTCSHLRVALVVVVCCWWPAVSANWMYLGMSGVSVASPHQQQQQQQDQQRMGHAADVCRYLPGLSAQQKKVCESRPDTIRFVGAGARQAIYECQYQFRYERWNCTIQIGGNNLLAMTLSTASKETAFVYAVTSAGVVHAVTHGCSSGNLSRCSCDMSNYGNANKDGWKWGGCSDNVHYGDRFARDFVDAPDRATLADKKKKATANKGSSKDNNDVLRHKINLHNNRAGRLAVKSMMRTQCRCHGVSGSCELKTCWKTMPPFSVIGAHLKNKYKDAVQVMPKATRRLRRRKKSLRSVKIRKEDLVHTYKSPNFCLQDASRGVLGTHGRRCNKTSTASDGCNLLCCGRGYNTQVIERMERCHCKFFWCCEVKCKTCYFSKDVHTCK